MIDSAMLLALLASLFLLIVPIAALTRGLIDGVRAYHRTPQPVRVAATAPPRRGTRRG